jgi:D-aspartate ligase
MGVDASTPAVVLKLYAQGALGAIRTLGRLGVQVYGVHEQRRNPVAGSRFVRNVLEWNLDEASAEASVEQLLEFGRRIGGDPLLIATDDPAALFVEDHAELLREAFRFPAQPEGLARQLYSKQGMHDLCRRLGTPTPQTEFPQNREDVEAWIETRGRFPVVLKPIDAWRLHRTGRKMMIVRSAEELLFGYERMEDPHAPNFMLQEYIPGGPDSVWMFNGYFDAGAECLVAFTGRKLRQRPPYTGMTSLGVCVRNAEVEEATRNLMKAVGYRGVVDIGWRYDERDGLYKLLDVNPRVGNTFRLFVGTDGMDVVRALYLDLTGQPVPSTTMREGRKWVVEDFDIASSLTYFRDRKLTLRDWVTSFRGIEEAAWWASDDPRPFARMSADVAAKLARRATAPLRP